MFIFDFLNMYTNNIEDNLIHVHMNNKNKLHVYKYYCTHVLGIIGIVNMAITVRLNDKEQEALRKKCVELNKALINKNLMPIKDSELVHIILEQCIEAVEITTAGKIVVVEPKSD